MAAALLTADPAVRRIAEELKTHLEAVRTIAATADDAKRDFTDEERAQVGKLMEKVNDCKSRLEVAKGDAELRRTISDLGEDVALLDDTKSADDRRREAAKGGFAGRAKSYGEHFVESKAYRDLMGQAPSGVFGEKQRVQSTPQGYETLLPERMGRKALVTGASETSAGALVDPQSLGVVAGPEELERPLTLRDVVTSGTTDTDTIDYVKYTGFTNNAAVVPEATATSGTSGLKPESGFSLGKDVTYVRTIAHWIPVTKRALSDAAQIRTVIDAFLLYGLEETLEEEMISGDGTGEHLLGLENISGTQAQAAVTDPVGAPPGLGNFLALRRAKSKVRLFGSGPAVGRAVANAYVMHPEDLQMLDEVIDGNGRFYGDGPFGANDAPSIWGLPVIENHTIARGKAWCADWRNAVLWDREQANITMSDSHENFFVRNMVAVLAEMRCAFAVLKPAAFVEVELTEPV